MKPLFYKFTTESPAASYIPFPRFLMDDCFAGLGRPAVITLNYPANAKLITKKEVALYVEEDMCAETD